MEVVAVLKANKTDTCRDIIFILISFIFLAVTETMVTTNMNKTNSTISALVTL